MRAVLSGGRDRLRRSQRPEQPRLEAARQPASLHGPRGARHAAERRLPDARRARQTRRDDAQGDDAVIAWSVPAPDRHAVAPSRHRTRWIDGDPTLRDITDDVMRP